MTQNEMIIEMLKEDGFITTYSAFIDLGCSRLAARILELKTIGGYKIGSLKCHQLNRFGTPISFNIYYLDTYYHSAGVLSSELAMKEKMRLEAMK